MALHELAVPAVAGAEDEHLHPLVTALERAGDGGGDTNDVLRLQRVDGVVESDRARSGDDEVDLLGVLVTVSERLVTAGQEREVGKARSLRPTASRGKRAVPKSRPSPEALSATSARLMIV